LAGVDPAGDDPALATALDQAGFLVVQEMFLTETAAKADVVLPVQAFTEREGSFTNGERRVQRYYPAVPPRPENRPDFAVTAGVAGAVGVELEGRGASLVFEAIAAAVPDYAGLNYRELARVVEQWPIVGHDQDERYYGGTTYHNDQGLGVQLESGVQRGEFPALTWPKLLEELEGEGLVAYPVTRLYDLGRTVAETGFLAPRIPEPYAVLSPDDAEALGVTAGEPVHLLIDGSAAPVVAHLDEALPAGVVLVPRSLGVPISRPTPIELKVLETA
jgi:NADH-quinone oxidoreductase subunit G